MSKSRQIVGSAEKSVKSGKKESISFINYGIYY